MTARISRVLERPSMLLQIAGILFGGLLLYLGAEWLVKGAAGLARSFGVPPLIVGLTVVGYGTSMPELVVSSVAAADGKSAIALGNVIGSNIANVGLIFGVSAIVRPLTVTGSLIRREVPVLFGSALLAVGLLLDGTISRVDAGLLLAGAVGFTWLTLVPALRMSSADLAAMESDAEVAGAPAGTGRVRLAFIAAVGLVLLVGGGKLFVDGAAGLASAFGVSERVVGLTIVAIGTSLPELAASIVATVRGHSSLAIGNVVGSNIFNVLFVLGGAALIHPIHGSVSALRFDFVALLFATVAAAALLRRERRIVRAEGVVLLVGYAVFVALAALLPK